MSKNMSKVNPKLTAIFDEINKHNQDLYDSTPYNKKIDYTKSKKSWGSELIPKEFWIDLSKDYKTLDGRTVRLHEIRMSNGHNEVTFPVKGIIITSHPTKKDQVQNAIWTLDGRFNVVHYNDSKSLVLA